ncbi:MAG: YlxR family protein [Clostridia bacterium]|nr:YlxR family protein [Clostridia bacterium]
MMTTKKIPMRKCIGCGEMFPKKELVRVVKTKTGEENGQETYTVSLDKTGKAAGRGAYICKKAKCLEAAVKAKRLQRAFECQIPDEVFERMTAEIESDE